MKLQLNDLSISLAAVSILLVLALLLSFSQAGFGWGRYEWEVSQPFQGRLRLSPYPALEVARVLESQDFSAVSVYPLSNAGRGSFTRNLSRFDGEVISLNARVLCSGDLTMLEVAEDSIETAARVVEFPLPDAMREQTGVVLRGEITDLKSYLGFREPGLGDLLRSPAANAIRAGIPPVLVVTDQEGRQKALMLVDEKMQPVGDAVLGQVAVPVEIRGKLWTWGGFPVLAADPAGYRRLGRWE